MTQPRFASFAIALPLYSVFDYSLETGDPVVAGTRYRLPFGNGTKTGVLLSSSDATEFDPARIKPVQDRLDQEEILGEHMLTLARWMSDYYLQPLGEVVFQCIPGYLRGSRPYSPIRVKRWYLAESSPDLIKELKQRSPRQFEICTALLRQSGLTAIELKQINPNWHPVVKALPHDTEGKFLPPMQRSALGNQFVEDGQQHLEVRPNVVLDQIAAGARRLQ